MAIMGWNKDESPFHPGELAIQARLGVQERMDRQGRRIVRDYLTKQHQQFFVHLPYVTVGTVDAKGRPWASILTGEPGFLSVMDERTLRVTAQPLLGDPLAQTLAEGVDVGLLGIDLQTRRRNRMNGVVRTIHVNSSNAHTSNINTSGTMSFDVRVRQSFGNCPQYIQSRALETRGLEPSEPPTVHRITTFSDVERTFIQTADTFFIATAYQDPSAGAASGVDVSHRGGKPGFVRVDGDGMLTVPDFSGNLHFNTFGNLQLNPRAGLLFVDFDQGDLLYLTGTATVIWEGPEVEAYAGAERLLRFKLEQGYHAAGSLPLRWSGPEFSPFLEPTGGW